MEKIHVCKESRKLTAVVRVTRWNGTRCAVNSLELSCCGWWMQHESRNSDMTLSFKELSFIAMHWWWRMVSIKELRSWRRLTKSKAHFWEGGRESMISCNGVGVGTSGMCGVIGAGEGELKWRMTAWVWRGEWQTETCKASKGRFNSTSLVSWNWLCWQGEEWWCQSDQHGACHQ